MRKKPTILMVALSAALAGGCGSTGAPAAAPAVASISKPPSTAAAAAAATTAPRARLDTTEAEKEAWGRAYWQCMKDHGARVDDSEKSKIIGFVDPKDATPEIFAACASKKPNFLPPEMDPDLNPDYRQQWHENVKCLQRRGMPVVETDDGWTYSSSNAVLPADEDRIVHECEIEAFTKK